MNIISEKDDISCFLKSHPSFTTREFSSMARESPSPYSNRKIFHSLHQLCNDGQLMKIGRGYYAQPQSRRTYHYELSPHLADLTKELQQQYPLINFQVWELWQWNEFVNHQLAHNAFFIDVESGLETTVFEYLLDRYPRVLFAPDADTYYRYRTDDMIIVQKLISQSPAPVHSHQTALEKLLVDLFSRKLTGQLIERAEYRKIYEDAFHQYAINESALFRYAGRRHVKKKIREFIAQETNIQLYLEE